jgi:SnoaL-like domain
MEASSPSMQPQYPDKGVNVPPTADHDAIRELVENWALWRDAGDWERFRTVWHDDGRMQATWWQGPYRDFITMSQQGAARGVRILHFLGGTAIDLAADRAIAQTKMTITQRADVDEIACDVVCTGRFYDFFERRDGRWGLVLRQPIYEQDRLCTVAPGPQPTLDPAILGRFPEGYRHLAYVQVLAGYNVKHDMPGLTGDEVARLYADGQAWLRGEPLAR